MVDLPLGRCPAAHPEDRRPCDSRPDAVLVVDMGGGQMAGCIRHAAQLCATVSESRIYPLAGGPEAAVEAAYVALSRTPFDFAE